MGGRRLALVLAVLAGGAALWAFAGRTGPSSPPPPGPAPRAATVPADETAAPDPAPTDPGADDADAHLEGADPRESVRLDDSPFRFRVVGPDDAPVHGGSVSVTFVSEAMEECQLVRLQDGACGVEAPDANAGTMWVEVQFPEDASGRPLPFAHGRFGPFPAAPGETVLRMLPELAISGRVVDETGRGVPAVTVTVRLDSSSSPGGSRWSSGEDSAVTGPDGGFRIGRLGDFMYTLGAEPNHDYVRPASRAVRGGAEGVLEELRRAVAPMVTVLAPDGQPLAGAAVEAVPHRGGRSVRSGTDTAGRARLAGLDPEPDHNLSVQPPAGRDDLLPAEVEAWEPRDTTVRLERGFPFRVVVRDRAGRPLQEIYVCVVTEDGDRRTGETDAEGAFRFFPLPAGTVHIETWIPGPGGAPGAVATATASTEQGGADLVLDPGGDAVVRVKGWKSDWWGLSYHARDSDPEPTQVGVKDDGTVRLRGLVPGSDYNVYVRQTDPSGPGSRCALVRGVRAGEPPREIELTEGRDITGTVILPEGVEDADGFAVAALLGETVLFDGHPERDGAFRIPAMPEGTWTVVIYLTTADGKYHAATGTAPAGGTVRIRVP